MHSVLFPRFFVVFSIRFPSSLYLTKRRGSSSTRGYYHFMMDFCLIDCYRNGQTQSRWHHISCRCAFTKSNRFEKSFIRLFNSFSSRWLLSCSPLILCIYFVPWLSPFLSICCCCCCCCLLLQQFLSLLLLLVRSSHARLLVFSLFCCYSSCSDIELLSLRCFMNNFVQEITRNQHTIKINAYNEQQHKWKIIIYQQQQRDQKYT